MIYIPATYIGAGEFSTPGSHEGSYRPGTRLVLYIGIDGQAESTVQAASYDVSSDRTMVTVFPQTCLPGLLRVGLGGTFCDEANELGNLAEHPHTGPWSGGYMPASRFSDSQVAALLALVEPTM